MDNEWMNVARLQSEESQSKQKMGNDCTLKTTQYRLNKEVRLQPQEKKRKTFHWMDNEDSTLKEGCLLRKAW